MNQHSPWLPNQNATEAQFALAASDYWWGLVQRLRACQLILVVIAPSALAIGAQFASWLVIPAGFVAFALTFVDTAIIYPYLGVLRRRGAQAQDIFDAIALGLPRSEIRRECDPDPSDLQIAASKQDRKRALRNADWYSPVLGELPRPIGRIACMLESVVWDGGLRERYYRAIFGSGVALLLVIIAYGLAGPHRDELVTRILFPLVPTIVWAGREWWDQFDASRVIGRIRERLQRLWIDAVAERVSDFELDAAAIDAASALFAYRSQTPPSPHALYSLLRPKQGVSMQRAAEIRTAEYQARNIIR